MAMLPMDNDVSHAAIKHRAGSRGDVIEVNGKTYQPTGPLDQRGFAGLTKKNPELMSNIAAKGGAHSHQGDPGVDQGRQQRYHQQDPALNEGIKKAGGRPRDEDGLNAGAKKGASQQQNQNQDREQQIQTVMKSKNVDRPIAQRVLARAERMGR